jgi:hypothetical protein
VSITEGRQRESADFVRDLLRDERKRGHIEHVGGGRWRASPDFVAEYGQDFSWLPQPRRTSQRRSET